MNDILSLYQDAQRFDAIAGQVSDDITWWQSRFIGPSHIIDLGCGTGRISLPLVKDGHQVIGIDNSPHMLAAARAKDSSQHGQWLEGDFSLIGELPKNSADGVILANNTLAHIHTEQQLLDLLQLILQVLKPGGHFYVDTFAPNDDLRQDGQEELLTYYDAKRQHDIVLVESHRFNPEKALMHVVWQHCLKGVKTDGIVGEAMTLRLWDAVDLLSNIQLSGFSAVRLAGDYDDSPFDDESPLILLQATK